MQDAARKLKAWRGQSSLAGCQKCEENHRYSYAPPCIPAWAHGSTGFQQTKVGKTALLQTTDIPKKNKVQTSCEADHQQGQKMADSLAT
jgi:hypothetical protein